MSTITAILEPHADGSLHLPLPAELQHRRVRVEATLEAADESEPAPRLGLAGAARGLHAERVAGRLVLAGPRVVRQAEVEAILDEFP